MTDLSLPRDVSELLGWVEAATPGTLIPAGELAERLRALPIVARAAAEPDHEEPDSLLTADKVAAWLDMNVQSVYRLAREGNLRKVQLSENTVRFRRADVERYIERRAS